jgi:DNA polymerase III subunit gamma/tau
VVALAEAKREAMLYAALRSHVHLVSFERGRIGFRPDANAPRDLANQLTRFLNEATARRWVVAISSDEGQATLRQQLDAHADAARARAKDHPLIKAVLEQFPGAKIGAVRTLKPIEEAPPETPVTEEAFSDDLLEPPPGED